MTLTHAAAILFALAGLFRQSLRLLLVEGERRKASKRFWTEGGQAKPHRWEGRLPRRNCSLRLFVAPPFAQQLIILSWVVAFEAIERVVRRFNGGSADLFFDCVDVLGGLFQTAQRHPKKAIPALKRILLGRPQARGLTIG
jgi:hypothetical protein